MPASFRFRFNAAPCARGQEHKRLAAAAGPIVVLYSRDPRRDRKYLRKQAVRGTDDLFGDGRGFANDVGGGKDEKGEEGGRQRSAREGARSSAAAYYDSDEQYAGADDERPSKRDGRRWRDASGGVAKQGGRRRAVSRTRHGTRGRRHRDSEHFDDDEGFRDEGYTDGGDESRGGGSRISHHSRESGSRHDGGGASSRYGDGDSNDWRGSSHSGGKQKKAQHKMKAKVNVEDGEEEQQDDEGGHREKDSKGAEGVNDDGKEDMLEITEDEMVAKGKTAEGRLKKVPNKSKGRKADAKPAIPTEIQFVPYPLPSIVTVVQGSSEIWARSLVDLNDLLTGQDILRIGTISSADYPVKARNDDIVRLRKPKPPPWWTRPDVLAAKTANKPKAPEVSEKEMEALLKEEKMLTAEAKQEIFEKGEGVSLQEAELKMEAAVEMFLDCKPGAVTEMEKWDAYIQRHPDFKPTIDVMDTSMENHKKKKTEDKKKEGISYGRNDPNRDMPDWEDAEERAAEDEFQGAESVDLLDEMSPGFGPRTSGMSWYPKKEALNEVVEIIGEPAKLEPKGKYTQFMSDLYPLITHAHSVVHTTALEVVSLVAEGLRGRFFDLCDGPQQFKVICGRFAKEKKLYDVLHTVLDSFFPLAVPLGKIADGVLKDLLDPAKNQEPFARVAIYEFLTRCCERTNTATLKVNGKMALDTKTKVKLMEIAKHGLSDLPEQAEIFMRALCMTGGMQGTSNKERYEMRVMTAYLDKMVQEAPALQKVGDRMGEALVEGVANAMG